MRRWRIAILIFVILPVYWWLLVAISAVGYAFILCLDEDISVDEIEWIKAISPLEWVENGFFNNWESLLSLPLPAFLVVGTQIIFLLPVFSSKLRVTNHGRSLMCSICAAGMIGGFLFTSLILGLFELLMLWESISEWAFGMMEIDIPVFFLLFWISIGACWLLWLPILFIFARKKGPHRLHEKIIVLLLAGTVLETLVIIPIDVLVRRRTECYCVTGTFLALSISIWAWLWLAGPGIILAITAKRRRLIAETHCINCGYAKGPSPGPVCPECGFDWFSANKTGDKPRHTAKKGG